MKTLLDYTGAAAFHAHHAEIAVKLKARHRLLQRLHRLPIGSRKRAAASAAYDQSWDDLCSTNYAWRRKQLATVVVRVRRDPSLAYQLREALDAARAEGLTP